MLLGVDDMDVFKGIELKLQAYERLLDEHPDWVGRVVLAQVGAAAGCDGRQTQSPALLCGWSPVTPPVGSGRSAALAGLAVHARARAESKAACSRHAPPEPPAHAP